MAQVQQFVPSALVIETELEVVEVAFLADLQLLDLEKGTELVQLPFRDRMLHDDDGVVYVPALDQSHPEKIGDLVQEDEGAAGTDLGRIVDFGVPMDLLDT